MKTVLVIAAFVAVTAAPMTYAQFGSGVVYDPTQATHAVVQIKNEERSIACRPALDETATCLAGEVRILLVGCFHGALRACRSGLLRRGLRRARIDKIRCKSSIICKFPLLGRKLLGLLLCRRKLLPSLLPVSILLRRAILTRRTLNRFPGWTVSGSGHLLRTRRIRHGWILAGDCSRLLCSTLASLRNVALEGLNVVVRVVLDRWLRRLVICSSLGGRRFLSHPTEQSGKNDNPRGGQIERRLQVLAQNAIGFIV